MKAAKAQSAPRLLAGSVKFDDNRNGTPSLYRLFRSAGNLLPRKTTGTKIKNLKAEIAIERTGCSFLMPISQCLLDFCIMVLTQEELRSLAGANTRSPHQ